MPAADRDRVAFALTASVATAARKTIATPAVRTLARRRLARIATALAGPQARKDATAALDAVLTAAKDGPVAAQAAMNAVADRHLPPGRPSVRHATLRAAAAITPEAKLRARTRLARAIAGRMPTLHFGRLAGIWASVYRRRHVLTDRHAKAVAEAWDACVAELGTRDLVRDYRRRLR